MNLCRHNLKLDRVLILGMGVSGQAAARLALQHQLRPELADSGNSPALDRRAAELNALGVAVRLGEEACKPPEHQPDLIVISPGVSPDSRLARAASELNRPMIGEFEFGARFCHAPILAVTGSNGKTTTVEITAHCLQQAGINAVAGGNIGKPLSEIALVRPVPRFIVAEASSFQLESVRSLQTRGAALLNLSHDHLDRHRSFTAYVQAKAKILQTVERADRTVLREDLLSYPEIAEKLRLLPGRPVVFSTAENPAPEVDFFLAGNGDLCRRQPSGKSLVLARRDQLKIHGRHNLENAMAAMALCEIAGLTPRRAGEALATFQAGRHRLEKVLEHNGVLVVDDSKSTNPDSLCRALQCLFDDGHKQIILIAGGLDKGMDFSPVKPWLRKAVRKILCIGSCRHRLVACWNDDAACEPCDNLPQAVTKAVASAQSGDTVLLSPACASQDMFTDYAERGRIFIELISKEIKK